MCRRAILFFLCWLASSQLAVGAVVVINETFDLTALNNPSSVIQNTLSTPVQIGVGDQVEFTASFLPGQYLRFDNDPTNGEELRLSLNGSVVANQNFDYTISDVSVTFQGLQGTAIPFDTTQSSSSFQAQNLDVQSIALPPNNFLAPGEFTIISGLTITYDVDQLTQDPDSFTTASLLALGGTLVVPEPTAFTFFAFVGFASFLVAWTRNRLDFARTP